jgi:DNA-binding IclR family transcriptional regulator
VASRTVNEKQEAPAEHRNQVQVIARAAAILRVLEDQEAGLSLAQIAARVGLPRSTVQRIVNALAAERFLISASPNGRVVLGPALLRLASNVATSFTSVARPYLQRLSDDLKETVDLAAIKKDRLIFIDQVEGSHRLRAVSAIGESFPLHCTANGKAYLATLDNSTVEQLVGKTLAPRTPQTIVTLPHLLKDLARVRKRGVAIDREEHTIGICAVGIAVTDQLGNPHAISVPVPAARFEISAAEIAARLLETKIALTALLDDARPLVANGTRRAG